jgi:hypothetical protein
MYNFGVVSNPFLLNEKHSYDKGNISIPIDIYSIPQNTKSLVAIFYDVHPVANNWLHWVVIDIPPTITHIEEGISNTDKMPIGCLELNNSFETKGYAGPCPPKDDTPHEYKLCLYAMSVDKLDRSKLQYPDYLYPNYFKENFGQFILGETSISTFYI